MNEEAQSIQKTEEPWRPALNFIIEGIGTIDRYRTRDLYALCGIEYAPSQAADESGEAFRRRFDRTRRLFQAYVAEMKRDLGQNLKVDLRATGEGAYEIVPHERHVRTVMRETLRDVGADLEEGKRRLDSFDTSKASAAQMREHADAAAHLDSLRRMAKSRRR